MFVVGIGFGSAKTFRMSDTTLNPVACDAHISSTAAKLSVLGGKRCTCMG